MLHYYVPASNSTVQTHVSSASTRGSVPQTEGGFLHGAQRGPGGIGGSGVPFQSRADGSSAPHAQGIQHSVSGPGSTSVPSIQTVGVGSHDRDSVLLTMLDKLNELTAAVDALKKDRVAQTHSVSSTSVPNIDSNQYLSSVNANIVPNAYTSHLQVSTANSNAGAVPKRGGVSHSSSQAASHLHQNCVEGRRYNFV